MSELTVPIPPESGPRFCGARRAGYVLAQWPCARLPHADGEHSDVHGVTWPMTPTEPSVRAAAGVIAAEMAKGHSTAVEIATAEASAGILFDPQRAEDIRQAAREQAAAEYRAELDRLREYTASLEYLKAYLDAVRQLCAGRPDTDLMTVKEILGATGATTPATRSGADRLAAQAAAGKDTPTGGGFTRTAAAGDQLAEGGER